MIVNITAGSTVPRESGATNSSFNITLRTASPTPLAVKFNTTGSVATLGTDYTFDLATSTGITAIDTVSNTITLAANVTSATLAIKPIDDNIIETGGETIQLTLEPGTGYTLGASSVVRFASPTNFGVGNLPGFVITEDFNGDGFLDLGVANYSSNNISVLLGNGTGSFASATNFGVGNLPGFVITEDFNGDGFLDLAAANRDSNNVSVLLGNGTGSFASATNFGVGNLPGFVITEDFNGDGFLDLAAANRDSNNVSVLLGNGTGSFASATNFGVGNLPGFVITEDFNGDGFLDLGVANLYSNNISVLLNISFPTATQTIADNDPVTVQFSVPTYQVNQDGTVVGAGVTITRTADAANPGSVQVQLANGTATDGTQPLATGTDFHHTTQTINFAANQTSKTVTIPINDDPTVEPNETLTLTLVNPSPNFVLGTQTTATLTILDANVNPTVTLAVAPSTVNEDGSTNLVYTFNRKGDLTKSLTVNFNVAGTATFNTDYTTAGAASFSATNGSITFAAGSNTATLTIDPNADVSIEPNETVVLTLIDGANYIVGTSTPVAATITNDESNQPPQLSNINKSADEDNDITFSAADFSNAFTDANSQNLIQIRVTSLPSNGMLKLGSDNVTQNQEIAVTDLGNLRFTPNPNWNGNTSFNWNGFNGIDFALTPATVNLIVNSVNDPVVFNPLKSEIQFTPVDGGFLLTFSEESFFAPDLGDTITYTATLDNGNPLPSWLSFNPFSRSFTSIITSGVVGSFTLLVRATDGGNATAIALLNITISNMEPDCFCDQIVLPDIDINPNVDRNPNPIEAGQSGSNSDDTIVGTDASDSIDGFGGNDLLDGKAGRDNLIGGIGNDTIVGGSDRDWILGNQGDDLIGANTGNDFISAGPGNDTVYGGQGNDFARGDTDNDLIFGDIGNDTVSGDLGNDTIYGGTPDIQDRDTNGRDLLFGGGGDDFMNGTQGQDTLFGNDGKDTVRGGQNDDIVIGNADNDLLFGDKGNDSLCGDDGNDIIYGGNGSDIPITKGSEQDVLCGGKGDDLLFGNEGLDNLNGDIGNDTLYGGKEDDMLAGGAGNDWLSGDLGCDVLRGGSGNDIFIFAPGTGTDVIFDFQDGEDFIALRGDLSFPQLTFTQSNDSVLMSVKSSGEFLAVLNGNALNQISQQDVIQLD